MSEQIVTDQQHRAIDPQSTWDRMTEMVKKAVTTPRSAVEKSIAQEQTSKLKRNSSNRN